VFRLAVGQGDLLAALERRPGNQFRLTVWNYRSGSQLYAIDLSDPVLQIAFSPRGTHLVCTLARWNSLLFLDLQNGKFRDWLSAGFGLVDFSLLSSKEDRVMSYQASGGVLVYHDLASGSELKRIATKPRLQALQLIPDGTKTRAIALDNGIPVLIDLVAGSTLAARPLDFPVTQILCDESNPAHLVALGGTPGALRIVHLTLDAAGRMVPGPVDKSTMKTVPGSAALLAGQLVMGDQAGRLSLLAANDQRTPLNDVRTAPILSFAFFDQGIYLTNAAGGLRIGTDLFGQPGTQTARLGRFDQSPVTVLPAAAELRGLNDREILFWDSGRTPRINRLDSRKDTVSKSSAPLNAAILAFSSLGDQASLVDAGGNLRVFNLPELRQTAVFPARGAFCSQLIGDGLLMFGQGASGSESSPLRRVTLKSGETVSQPGYGNVLFQLAINQGDRSLYALASATENGKPVNVLLQGGADGITRQLLTVPGEDLAADLRVAADGSILYTSLGGTTVSSWNGSTFASLESAPHSPRKLAVYQDWLGSLNSDGSLSLYHLSTGKLVLDIRLSTGGTAFALTRYGSWLPAQRVSGAKASPSDPKELQYMGASLAPVPDAASTGQPPLPVTLPLALE
jgi:WD40 repeat protein